MFLLSNPDYQGHSCTYMGAPAHHLAGGVPGCLFTSLDIVISFRGCQRSVTAKIKTIAGKRENGFNTFPGVRFMQFDVPPYSRNIGKETEAKTN
jgi:hypothetical protein